MVNVTRAAVLLSMLVSFSVTPCTAQTRVRKCVAADGSVVTPLADRIVVMEAGRIAQIGTPREVYEQPENLFVAKFVGEINTLTGKVCAVHGDGSYDIDLFGHVIDLRARRRFAAGDAVKMLSVGAQEAAKILKDGFGWTVDQAGQWLVDVGGYTDSAVNAALSGAGYAAGEVANFMGDVFGGSWIPYIDFPHIDYIDLSGY